MACRTLVILAAGRGRRFGGEKQLAPVGPHGETIMDYLVALSRRVGFERVIVVTRPELGPVLAPLSGRDPGLPVEIVYQAPAPGGTVPAVLAAREQLGDEPFAVVNADDLYPEDALGALQRWSGPGHAVVGFRLAATLLPRSGPVNRALCQVGEGGRLVGLVEMSVTPESRGYVGHGLTDPVARALAPDQLVSMNAWALDPSIWSHLSAAAVAGGSGADVSGARRSAGGSGGGACVLDEVLLPVAIGALVAAGSVTVTCVAVAGSCFGITWPDELAPLQAIVAGLVAEGRLPARL